MAKIPTLGYWDIRALGQPIRYLLKYIGINFIDKRYQYGEGTTLQEIDSIRKYWNRDKFNLGLDFPNLPFYIDGDVKISQSLTIMRYIGRKHGLIANDTQSLVRQDLVEQQLQDLRKNFIWGIMLCDVDFEKNEKKFTDETLPQQLELLSKFLGTNEWFAGPITYVDFLAYELIDWFRQYRPHCLDKWINLIQYMQRFESLPPIAAYMSSNEFKSWPILSPRCKWGYHIFDQILGAQKNFDF